MKKIGVYLQAGPSCGGTYQYNHLIVEVLSALPKDEYQIVAYYGADHWKEFLAKTNFKSRQISNNRIWTVIAGIWRRLNLPIQGFRNFAKNFHPLAKAMLNEGCDLWIFPSQDAYAYLMPVNALATIHDLMHRYERKFPEVGSEKEYKIREFHYQNMSHFAKGILVDSELGKQHVIESYGIAQENCHVLAYIAPKDIHKHYSIDFDKKFRLPAKFLLYPAQFWEHKNHANLLKALAKCRERCSDIQLVLVGSKKNGYEKAIQLISDLKLEDAVHILGYVDDNDLIELYRRARGLIMPTFFGPTNIPPLEAHAIGCPVAISGIYAMRDQLGNAALFFDPYQVEDILDKLTLIWQDDVLCKDLILKGQERHQLWNFDHFKSKLIDILNTMLHISSEPRQYRSR